MSDEKTAEQIKAEANPAAQIPATAEVKKGAAQAEVQPSAAAPAKEAQPDAAKPSEKTLSNLAYIKMRQEKKALKAELEQLRAAKAVPQTQQAVSGVVTPAQAQPEAQGQAVVDPNRLKAEIIAELRAAETNAKAELQKQESEQAALKSLAEDSDISGVPDGIAEVLDLIDNDPKYARLNAIDPALALREAKTAFCEKHGITPTVQKPVKHPHGGGSMPTQIKDLDAIAEKLKTLPPNSPEFRQLVKQLNEAAKEHYSNG